MSLRIAAAPELMLGYFSGNYYGTWGGSINTATAYGATLDTLIALYPFSVRQSIAPATIAVRTLTGAASSAIKIGIWAHSYTTTRPTGLALTGLVSNTGQATTSNGSNAEIATTGTLLAGVPYWVGVAVTTAAPTFESCSSAGSPIEGVIGRTALGAGVRVYFTTSYAYSGDITTLDLTGATFTGVSANGVPVVYFKAP